jgi:uracil-DNA glycosylase
VTQRDLAEIVEAGWAAALEPVAGRIAALGAEQLGDGGAGGVFLPPSCSA